MSILSEIFSCKRYIKTENGYKRVSEWTKAENVEMDNGKTLENLVSDLTADNAITEVKIVSALPSDAESHPTTFYLVKG